MDGESVWIAKTTPYAQTFDRVEFVPSEKRIVGWCSAIVVDPDDLASEAVEVLRSHSPRCRVVAGLAASPLADEQLCAGREPDRDKSWGSDGRAGRQVDAGGRIHHMADGQDGAKITTSLSGSATLGRRVGP